MGRKLASLIRALLLTLLAAGPAAAAPHDTLTIGLASFPSNMHPSVDPEVVKFYVLGFVNRPVTAFDADWKNTCLLCTELPTIANGGAVIEGDGLAVTIHFKPDLAWGDGAPVGAADLAFTARAGRDPASGFVESDFWSKISRVDVPDPLTAIVHFTQPTYRYNQFPEMLPAHLEQPVFDAAKAPGEYLRQSAYMRMPTNPGLYNGPYVVSGYDTGANIVLARNPAWHGATPAFRQIVIKTIGNTAALQSNLLSGDIDMVPGEGIGLTLDQVLALQRQSPDRFAYAYKPNLNYDHIDLQLDNPILADIRVRRALLMGLDRKSIVDRLLGGRVPVADSFISPLEATYAPDVAKYPFDPAAARALLREAGWTPGGDGVCRNAAGERLSLEFTTGAGNRARELQEQVMQSQWKAIGVEVTIRNEPARTLFGETLKHRAFTGMAMFAWIFPIGSSPRQILHSGQIPTAANNWGGTDYTGFSNPRMDTDIDAMERELDPVKQAAVWADMQRLYAEQLPVLPLHWGSEAHVWPLWLHGVTPTGHSQPVSLWTETWTAD